MAQTFGWKYRKLSLPTPRQAKVYTMLGMTLTALIVFGAFAIRPTLKTVTELRRKIKDQEFARDKLDQKIKDLSLAQTQLTKNKADLPLVQAALPHEREISQILEMLNGLCEKNELRLSQIRSEDKVTTREQKLPNQTLKTQQIAATLVIEGDFPHFLKFLKELENSRRQVNIEEVKIDAQKTALVRFDLILDTYYTEP